MRLCKLREAARCSLGGKVPRQRARGQGKGSAWWVEDRRAPWAAADWAEREGSCGGEVGDGAQGAGTVRCGGASDFHPE